MTVQADLILKEAIAQIPDEERMGVASAMWRHSEGMGVALKAFTTEVVQQLQNVPEITLTGIQRDTNEAGQLPDSLYPVRFGEYSYTTASGDTRTAPSVSVIVDGEEKQFGAISSRSMHLSSGSFVEATISIDASGKTAKLQVLDLLDEPESSDQALYLSSNQDHPQSVAAEKPEQYQENQPLTIITNGACSGNPGPGGWGAILVQGDTYREIGGAAPETTNNRMEMTAGIEALKYAREEGLLDSAQSVKIVSDSQIFIHGATGDWKRKANRDLWAEYDQASSGATIEFEWVRGHNGHALNERVDAIATAFTQGKNPDLKQGDAAITSKASPSSETQKSQEDATQEDAKYNPSRHELVKWYKAVKEEGSDLERQGEIRALGQTLKRLYNIEQGTTSNPVNPPDHYRHPAVEISESDRQQMQKDTANTIAKAERPRIAAQVEL